MSQTTLGILNQHRAAQIQNSPSSELFTIQGGSTFYGIFDNAHFENEKDRGNFQGKKRMPMIMVAEEPDGLTPGVSIIVREDGVTTYTFQQTGSDQEGVPILWLF